MLGPPNRVEHVNTSNMNWTEFVIPDDTVSASYCAGFCVVLVVFVSGLFVSGGCCVFGRLRSVFKRCVVLFSSSGFKRKPTYNCFKRCVKSETFKFERLDLEHIKETH